MPKTCAVGGCSTRSGKSADAHYSIFPKDDAVRSKWIRFVKTTRPNYKFSVWTYICSKHFTDDCINDPVSKNRFGYKAKFKLKKGSVPTIKAPSTSTVSTLSRSSIPLKQGKNINKCKSSASVSATARSPFDSKSTTKRPRPLVKATSASLACDSPHSTLPPPPLPLPSSQGEGAQGPGVLGPSTSVQNRERCIYIRLTEVNSYIICHLCGGYLVDATTIIECLHTFCRSCLVPYIQKHDLCPTCDILIHPSNPYLSIKLDPTIQDIVYKLLPYIQEDESARQKRFWKELNLEAPRPEIAAPEPVQPKVVEPHVAVVLEYAGASDGCPNIVPLQKKFILVPSRVTVRQIQNFVTIKLHLESPLEVDIVCDEEILEPDISLKHVWTQSTEDQMQDGMLCLFYSITSSQEEPS